MFVSASNEVLEQKETWVVDGINGYVPNKRVVTWPPTPLPQLPFISPPVQYVVASSAKELQETRVAAASKMVERRAFQETPQIHQIEVRNTPENTR